MVSEGKIRKDEGMDSGDITRKGKTMKEEGKKREERKEEERGKENSEEKTS